jgi:ribosomal-protein-alanine N-acetyltransferase
LTNDSTIAIRPATLADIAALLALQRRAPTSAQWNEDQYKDFFSDKGPSRLLLVAEAPPAQILGCLVAQHVARDWELENIVVTPELQRSGIGHRLLAALIESAKQSNSEAVFLEVRESNAAARRLYEKSGFHQTGRRNSYYSNPLEDAILYRLNLQ